MAFRILALGAILVASAACAQDMAGSGAGRRDSADAECARQCRAASDTAARLLVRVEEARTSRDAAVAERTLEELRAPLAELAAHMGTCSKAMKAPRATASVEDAGESQR